MAKFGKKEKRGTPGISTASLPDIVFMLLFFFMVTTVVRENPAKVQYTLPTTKFYEEIEDRSKIAYVYVGTLDGTDDKKKVRYEINGFPYAKLTKLVEGIKLKQSQYANPDEITFALKIDETNIDVGEVNKLKRVLQEAGVKLILYTSDINE